ncbi:MAG: MoxR family ATPase [Myxococcales bacterium]|jgi:MoxR-like ATPase|nr:MoxR family ATPase [Myxococcales bacterium]
MRDIDETKRALISAGYVASEAIATAAFLSNGLGKALLVEGPAGVGKTELGRALATATGRMLIRLQCYEGLDESRALYEWDYTKQLIYTQLLKEKVGALIEGADTLEAAARRIGESGAAFFNERFLLPRPVLQALLSDTPTLLLVDEIDKADPEFEAFLLEVFEGWSVTLPELGTIAARHPPRAVLTSNNARELSDALRRRCLHLWLDFPDEAREVEIVRSRLPGISERLARRVVAAVHKLRDFELKKPPSLSETLDWARALSLLGVEELGLDVLSQTLGVTLKHASDERITRERLFEVAEAAGRIG